MSDVLFVVPAFEPSILEESYGTLLLATMLKEKGIDVDIYRFFESDPNSGFISFVENSTNNILAKKPKIVSFYCRGDCYLANIRVAEKLKKENPQLIIVFGGPQADLVAKETLTQLPFIDYCCCGEGETTIYPLFSTLLKGGDVTNVKGLAYRDFKGNIISNPRPELFKNLDELPFIDYSLVPENILDNARKQNLRIDLDVGRGCPFNCAYCSTCRFWERKYRLKSARRIVDELKALHEIFGNTVFGLEHDLFTANKKKVLEFCHELKESGLPVEWYCSSRADTLDEELINEMVDSGLRRVFLGIETGSERMQKLSHKNLKLENIEKTIKSLLDKNVAVTASFIFGFPEETEDDLEQTLQLAYKLFLLRVHRLQFHLCVIFPGTEYFDAYKDQLVLAENVSNIVGDFGVKENRDFIEKHSELFPFYYEYRSDLRDRFSGMDKDIVKFMGIYEKLSVYDPEKIKDKRMVDLYLDFRTKTEEIRNSFTSSEELKGRWTEVTFTYLATLYQSDDYKKITGIFSYLQGLNAIKTNPEISVDVKQYDIDIAAVMKKKTLAEIPLKPTMVIFNRQENNISCNIKYLA